MTIRDSVVNFPKHWSLKLRHECVVGGTLLDDVAAMRLVTEEQRLQLDRSEVSLSLTTTNGTRPVIPGQSTMRSSLLEGIPTLENEMQCPKASVQQAILLLDDASC